MTLQCDTHCYSSAWLTISHSWQTQLIFEYIFRFLLSFYEKVIKISFGASGTILLERFPKYMNYEPKICFYQKDKDSEILLKFLPMPSLDLSWSYLDILNGLTC